MPIKTKSILKDVVAAEVEEYEEEEADEDVSTASSESGGDETDNEDDDGGEEGNENEVRGFPNKTIKTKGTWSEEYVNHAYHILLKALEMLRERGGYDVKELISSLDPLSNDPVLFQTAILSPKFENPLRDVLAKMYTKRTFPSLRVMMSLMVGNPEGHYTAVFFAERKASQVSKKLMELFFRTLAELKSTRFKITEIIFIAPVQLSHESESTRKGISGTYFTQVFIDEEIMSPPPKCIFSPKIRIYTPQETRAFFETETRLTPARMQQISHVDVLFKYLGARRHRVVEIVRPPLITSSLVQENLTYAWVF